MHDRLNSASRFLISALEQRNYELPRKQDLPWLNLQHGVNCPICLDDYVTQSGRECKVGFSASSRFSRVEWVRSMVRRNTNRAPSCRSSLRPLARHSPQLTRSTSHTADRTCGFGFSFGVFDMAGFENCGLSLRGLLYEPLHNLCSEWLLTFVLALAPYPKTLNLKPSSMNHWANSGVYSAPNNQHTEPKPQTQIAGFHFASSLQLSLLGVYVYAYIYIYRYRYKDIDI